MVIAFIIYLIFLLIVVLFSIFVLYHLIKYSFGENFVKAMNVVFLSGIIIIFIITLILINRVEINFSF